MRAPLETPTTESIAVQSARHDLLHVPSSVGRDYTAYVPWPPCDARVASLGRAASYGSASALRDPRLARLRSRRQTGQQMFSGLGPDVSIRQ